jgi:hypothetical protein
VAAASELVPIGATRLFQPEITVELEATALA